MEKKILNVPKPSDQGKNQGSRETGSTPNNQTQKSLTTSHYQSQLTGKKGDGKND